MSGSMESSRRLLGVRSNGQRENFIDFVHIFDDSAVLLCALTNGRSDLSLLQSLCGQSA